MYLQLRHPRSQIVNSRDNRSHVGTSPRNQDATTRIPPSPVLCSTFRYIPYPPSSLAVSLPSEASPTTHSSSSISSHRLSLPAHSHLSACSFSKRAQRASRSSSPFRFLWPRPTPSSPIAIRCRYDSEPTIPHDWSWRHLASVDCQPRRLHRLLKAQVFFSSPVCSLPPPNASSSMPSSTLPSFFPSPFPATAPPPPPRPCSASPNP